MRRRTSLSIASCAILLTLTGCFRDRWQAAVAELPPGADLLAGTWEGAWEDEDGNEGGALRCIATRRADGTYDAEFHATFAKVLASTQQARLTVVERGAEWRFQGEADLGLLGGGVYRYDGSANGKRFMCSYTSSYYNGRFRMVRPATPARNDAAPRPAGPAPPRAPSGEGPRE